MILAWLGMRMLPCGVRNRTLRHDPHTGFHGLEDRQLNRFLVGNVHRGLQCVEHAEANRNQRVVTIAAIADEPGLPCSASAVQNVDHISLLQDIGGAGVELNEIDMRGLKAFQTPLNALHKHRRIPVCPIQTGSMSTLGEQQDFIAPASQCAAEFLLAVSVALRGIEDVHSGVHALRYDGIDLVLGHVLRSDFRPAECELADAQASLSQQPVFHASMLPEELPYAEAMLRRSFVATPLALLAAPPKLPPLAQKIQAFGMDWSVFDASDWQVEGSGAAAVLHLKVARPQQANPRAPLQYALADGDALARFTMEVEIKPALDEKNKPGHNIVVYAWRDNLHFNYVHLSSDTGKEQPVHNGVFHVYGGDRVRISNEEGSRAFPNAEWTPIRVTYDGSKGLVETWVRGEKNTSLRGIDLSLGAGRIGLGSFFHTGSFRNFKLTRG